MNHEVVIRDQSSDLFRISQVSLQNLDVVVSSRQGVQHLLVLVDDGDFERFFFCEVDGHRATDEATAEYDQFHLILPFHWARGCAPFRSSM
jgi:hypothetical protein